MAASSKGTSTSTSTKGSGAGGGRQTKGTKTTKGPRSGPKR